MPVCCQDCRFYVTNEHFLPGEGICVRYPPGHDMKDRDGEHQFPVVKGNCTPVCGEYKAPL